MESSWTNYVSECKSRLSAIARSCYLRRVHWREMYQEAREGEKVLREEAAHWKARCRQLEQENGKLCQRVSELEAHLAESESRSIQLPVGEAPPGLQYGANLIALSVNLGRKIGVRRTRSSLKIF